MKNFSFSVDKDVVSAKEAIKLYLALKWGNESKYDENKMKQALESTTMVISARDRAGKLVGLTRVLSDGVIHTSVADIAVHPEYQGQGIGTQMMELVKKQYGHTGIFVDAFKENEKFFMECGYKKRDMIVLSKLFVKEPSHIA
ncbi:MAG: hypothetical protein A3B74_04125 [Candidatus Kerfeldbacteria bacterium RIFCSPHIGHO2_02_FULL_42_14]|uniref:N-acetyltransferase domain-containing protein n=1 Tax=Candidatus Kerfeldbacteria bacterium RIFCSPHIGHO2_02_FULL_42_14 TaxID=1798540 RepID=A0A1G2AQ68_9BACT|nr:MAG: hypothetical protein A3B74_04125 [Candidatus Kerfeldbacteria bacterium RIFCSPHIGHO2_02_FULL_42_14]OGY80695.1 MAG: hypothetical protein A3E60_04620 [Candidatus Kerfeldbacteria bacterium RIFCSPHIGHO2_12_FULL_42_13]OGY82622.1 MAG: hypothetical protein A3I91_04285 [Candidatus Kerfeldbacteria bacterium RIFCSPLOWO2_02_FULL_42_19]OGY85225.1 MAG: hypothetical protein A3G01_01415 [Candidatus Kerfeldbacteria bacterium RIFCSPLOWO2_12_FULL_43_9]